MKSIKEIRRDNLRKLIDEAGSRQQFTDRHKAGELGISYGFVGHLLTGNRGIGDAVALKLEAIGGKAMYWLDQDHDPAGKITGSTPKAHLVEILNAADRAINDSRRHFTYDEKIALYFEALEFAGKKDFSEDFIHHYVRELAKEKETNN